MSLSSALKAMFDAIVSIGSGSGDAPSAISAIGDVVGDLHKTVQDVIAEIEAIKAGSPLPVGTLVADVKADIADVGTIVETVEPALIPVVASVEAGAAVAGDAIDAIASALSQAIAGLQALKTPNA
jgi:hypothetical protein